MNEDTPKIDITQTPDLASYAKRVYRQLVYNNSHKGPSHKRSAINIGFGDGNGSIFGYFPVTWLNIERDYSGKIVEIINKRTENLPELNKRAYLKQIIRTAAMYGAEKAPEVLELLASSIDRLNALHGKKRNDFYGLLKAVKNHQDNNANLPTMGFLDNLCEIHLGEIHEDPTRPFREKSKEKQDYEAFREEREYSRETKASEDNFS